MITCQEKTSPEILRFQLVCGFGEEISFELARDVPRANLYGHKRLDGFRDRCFVLPFPRRDVDFHNGQAKLHFGYEVPVLLVRVV